MQEATFEIRKIRRDEISLIRDFPPPGWNSDLEKVYNQHYDQDYFYPVVATINAEIVGTGIAVLNGSATWLGSIIVKESYRNKGIGNSITKHLIDFTISKGNETIILTASELGFPIYQKIGFKNDISYLFFRSDDEIKIDRVSKYISPIIKSDYEKIIELDFFISGEKREKLLTSSLSTGFKYKEDTIEGFYLPDFGKGLILADSENAGIEMLKFRLSLDNSPVCVPETNKPAIEYLTSLGYYQYFKAPRMFLNKNVNWIPKMVYSRGCGYLG